MTLSLAGLWPPLSIPRLGCLVGLGVAFDASRGFNGYTFPFLYNSLPPFRGLRVPARFSMLVGFSLALLSAYGARRLISVTAHPPVRAAIAIALVAGVLADLAPRLRLEKVWPEPPPIYASIGPDAVLAEFPFPAPEDSPRNMPYMYFSVWHWGRLINGYSGSSPRRHDPIARLVSTFPDPAGVEALRSLGPTHVTVNCALFVRGDCQSLLDYLDHDAGHDARDSRTMAGRDRRAVPRAASSSRQPDPLSCCRMT